MTLSIVKDDLCYKTESFFLFSKATSYMETSLDDSDVTDYSDLDYVPDSEAGSSSEPDEDTPLYPLAKKAPAISTLSHFTSIKTRYSFRKPRKNC